MSVRVPGRRREYARGPIQRRRESEGDHNKERGSRVAIAVGIDGARKDVAVGRQRGRGRKKWGGRESRRRDSCVPSEDPPVGTNVAGCPEGV